MKKYVALSIIFLIMIQLFTGCSKGKAADFKEFYSQVIGFSEKDEKSKPIPKDALLMLTNKEYESFKEKYFVPREIPISEPDQQKAVLFVQIPSSSSNVKTYTVKSIDVKNNTLTVNLKKASEALVDGKSGFKGTWKWIMLIEVDKAQLTDNMKVIVKK